MIVSLISIFLNSSAYAGPAAVVSSRGFFEHLRATLPKGQAKFMDQRTLAAEARREGYLPPDQRDAVFRKLKLDRALAKYDEVDKDLLVMFVRDSNTNELLRIRKRFTNISMTDLRRLRLELGRIK